MKHALLAAAAFALTGLASAQVGAAPKIDRAEGVVTRLSDRSITLAEAGGKDETIALLPTWSVSVARPISVDEIKPGSYLGTTNVSKPDGSGQSTEVHVSPPGVKGPGLDFVMDAQAQTMMTNGVVAKVVKSEGGQVLEINYGSGVRRVTVPPGTPVVLNAPGSRDSVRVGRKIRLVTFTPPTGGPPRQIVTVEPDRPPAN